MSHFSSTPDNARGLVCSLISKDPNDYSKDIEIILRSSTGIAGFNFPAAHVALQSWERALESPLISPTGFGKDGQPNTPQPQPQPQPEAPSKPPAKASSSAWAIDFADDEDLGQQLKFTCGPAEEPYSLEWVRVAAKDPEPNTPQPPPQPTRAQPSHPPTKPSSSAWAVGFDGKGQPNAPQPQPQPTPNQPSHPPTKSSSSSWSSWSYSDAFGRLLYTSLMQYLNRNA